jgi:peroxiredoxin
MKTTLLWLTAVLLLPATLEAQQPKSPPTSPPVRSEGNVRPPASQIRISSNVFVGEAAPGFELTNATGARIKLSRFRGERVLLAFADRREAFSPFGAVAESLRAEGVQLVGVCHASPRSLRMIAERDSLKFHLLSDPTGQVSAVYGVFDFASSATRPGYVLVGRQGTVRMVVLGQTLPPADLLQLTRLALTGLP